MNKREFLKTSAMALITPAILAQTAAAKSHSKHNLQHCPLNLMFITVDDMNWSMLGCLGSVIMGGKRSLTPNLDRLAQRSDVFDNNRTVVPICQPAREAMMTGLNPQRSGGTGFTPVYDWIPTLTTILQGKGYFAGCVHKVGHMQSYSRFPWDYIRPGKDRSPAEYEKYTREVINRARLAGKPFFASCNINDPHRPFYGSRRAMGMDHNEAGPYKLPKHIKPVTPDEVSVPPFLEDLPQIREELAQYCNSVQRLDLSVGRMLKVLKETGHEDDTVVIFHGDHGMPFPFAKATGYSDGSRVPAIIHYPGIIKPRHHAELTMNTDIVPTLLDIMGIETDARFDGYSFWPLMKDKPYKAREYTFTQVNTIAGGIAYPSRTIQDHDYQLQFNPWVDGKLQFASESMWDLTFPAMVDAAKTNPKIAARLDQYLHGVMYALYDLKNDPGSRHNLIHDPAHKDRVAKMQAALIEEMERTSDPQLNNFKVFLGGHKPFVPQAPKVYRINDGKYEYPHPDVSKEFAWKKVIHANHKVLAGYKL